MLNALLSTALSGLLLTLSFPKIEYSWLAWISLVPILCVIATDKSEKKRAFLIGWITGLIHYCSLLYWLGYTLHKYPHLSWPVSVLVVFVLSAYLSCYIGLFTLFFQKLCFNFRLIFFAPFVWVAFEYLRSFLLSGFPWELLGHSQYNMITLIQITDIFGVYGVSFVIVSVNISVATILLYIFGFDFFDVSISRRNVLNLVAVTSAMIFISLIYGKLQINQTENAMKVAPMMRISLIQGNTPQLEKWKIQNRFAITKDYLMLSLDASELQPDLIVWPETALPYFFHSEKALHDIVLQEIRKANTAFVIGSPTFLKKQENIWYYNTAYVVRNDGTIIDRYDKVHLLPFAEYLPNRNILFWLVKWFGATDKDYIFGELGHVIKLEKNNSEKNNSEKNNSEKNNLGIQICYEIVFPKYSRHHCLNGANVLVNITNDGWFDNTSLPYQHFSMSVFRAIENRRTLVRVANTGITGFIEPSGKILEKSEMFTKAILTQDIPLMENFTFYCRYGDVFAILCLVILVICLIIKIIRVQFVVL